MASPLPSQKQSVALAPGAVRVSRIRRDPPPAVKAKPPRDPDERDTWAVATGIFSFTLALAIIFVAVSSYNGWSPRQYVIHF